MVLSLKIKTGSIVKETSINMITSVFCNIELSNVDSAVKQIVPIYWIMVDNIKNIPNEILNFELLNIERFCIVLFQPDKEYMPDNKINFSSLNKTKEIVTIK